VSLHTVRQNEYHIEGHILYRNTITKILEDKFGAEPPRHTRKGNVVIFNLDKLRKIQKSYEIDIDIKIETRKKNDVDCEGSEGSEGSRGYATLLDSFKTIENLNILQTSTRRNANSTE